MNSRLAMIETTRVQAAVIRARAAFGAYYDYAGRDALGHADR
jgi:hypothetical protein